MLVSWCLVGDCGCLLSGAVVGWVFILFLCHSVIVLVVLSVAGLVFALVVCGSVGGLFGDIVCIAFDIRSL